MAKMRGEPHFVRAATGQDAGHDGHGRRPIDVDDDVRDSVGGRLDRLAPSGRDAEAEQLGLRVELDAPGMIAAAWPIGDEADRTACAERREQIGSREVGGIDHGDCAAQIAMQICDARDRAARRRRCRVRRDRERLRCVIHRDDRAIGRADHEARRGRGPCARRDKRPPARRAVGGESLDGHVGQADRFGGTRDQLGGALHAEGRLVAIVLGEPRQVRHDLVDPHVAQVARH